MALAIPQEAPRVGGLQPPRPSPRRATLSTFVIPNGSIVRNPFPSSTPTTIPTEKARAKGGTSKPAPTQRERAALQGRVKLRTRRASAPEALPGRATLSTFVIPNGSIVRNLLLAFGRRTASALRSDTSNRTGFKRNTPNVCHSERSHREEPLSLQRSHHNAHRKSPREAARLQGPAPIQRERAALQGRVKLRTRRASAPEALPGRATLSTFVIPNGSIVRNPFPASTPTTICTEKACAKGATFKSLPCNAQIPSHPTPFQNLVKPPKPPNSPQPAHSNPDIKFEIVSGYPPSA